MRLIGVGRHVSGDVGGDGGDAGGDGGGVDVAFDAARSVYLCIGARGYRAP